jgi:hypothetical protein
VGRGIWVCLGVAAALATPPLVVVGCGAGDRPELVTPPDHDGGHGGLADASSPDAASADAPDALDAPDAPLAEVRVGITANPLDDAPGAAKEAALVTFAAGVRVVVERRRWADLDDAALAALASDVAFDVAHGARVVLELDVVDRLSDGRPNALAGLAWDDAQLVAALDERIDALLAASGTGVDALVLGRDVDVFLAEHEPSRGSFEVMATHALEHVHASAASPPGLRVGVGFSYEGAAAPDPSFALLRDGSDLVPLTYVPGLSGAPPAASAIAPALDSMIAAASGKPVALVAVGVPSRGAGSSDDKQALFHATFFAALAPRRASFPIASVFELDDLAPAACDALAAEQGEAPDGAFAESACSLGLFLGAEPKPAWIEVVKGAAAFASP